MKKLTWPTALLYFTCVFNALAQSATKPNIIIIVSDDAGNHDFGFQGLAEFGTPNIDRIAKEGAKFTNGYVSASVCSPSRAGLLTGKYQAKFGHQYNLGDAVNGLPTSEILITNRLKDLGYTTAGFGKWHLGYKPEYRPNARGFDYWYGFLGGAHPYFPGKDDGTDKEDGGENNWRENDKPVDEKRYSTDAIGQEATKYIQRSNSQPFFMYVAFNAVHSPMQAKKEIEDTISISDIKRRKLAAMTISLDENIGLILAALAEKKIEENTLVWFINDNGGATYWHFDNGQFRAYKGSSFEGGTRVPFAVKWPKHIAKGQTIDQSIISLDIARTSLALAGATNFDGLDGLNLMPVINDKKTISRDLFWDLGNGMTSIRSGDWKLINMDNKPAFLFDLKSDVREENNLANTNSKKVIALNEKLKSWLATTAKPLWTNGDYWFKNNRAKHVPIPAKNALKEEFFRMEVALKVSKAEQTTNTIELYALDSIGQPNLNISIPLTVIKNAKPADYLNKNINIVGLIGSKIIDGKKIAHMIAERRIQIKINTHHE